MNALDLDEAQGLTADMVREWMLGHGWKLGPAELDRSGYLAPGLFWTHEHHSGWWDGAVLERLDYLAEHHGLSIQALLRQINPRLRKGVPSEAARAAHQLAWVGVSGSGLNIMVGQWDGGAFRRGNTYAVHVDEWSFWPIDMSGSKIRWPERDGVLL
jgi:hypothetical protein